MLILTRKLGEKVYLTSGDGQIEVVVISVKGKQVKLGFVCDAAVQINRSAEYITKAVSGKDTASG